MLRHHRTWTRLLADVGSPNITGRRYEVGFASLRVGLQPCPTNKVQREDCFGFYAQMLLESKGGL
jgi:hypothetical protein